jgi:hypothetical protein
MMTADFSNPSLFQRGSPTRHRPGSLTRRAAGCNVQCRICNRKFDCVNESRPGVSSGVLSPRRRGAFLPAKPSSAEPLLSR